MRKFFLTLAAVLCCAMTTTVFTACGDDDEATPNDQLNQKSVVTVYYDFTLGKAYLQFYDVYCTFTDINGEVRKVQCTSPSNYYKESIDYDKAPDTYEFSVTGVRKENAPEVYPDSIYDCSHKYAVNVAVRPANNQEAILRTIMTKANSVTTSRKGDRMGDFLKDNDIVIIPKLTGNK